LSLIATFGILASIAIFIIWIEFGNLAFLISTALFFVTLGCIYILYKGFKQKQVIFSFAKVMIVVLVVSSIFMYSSINDLRSRVTALEKPQLSEVDWKYVRNYHYNNGTTYVNDTVKGAVFNSGINSVTVTVVFQAWDVKNLIHTWEYPLDKSMASRTRHSTSNLTTTRACKDMQST
jgi:hypothetical protein